MANDEQPPAGYALTLKQERFCQEYIIDGNAARAAREAGYSEDTAREIGCENLTKPHIIARIRELEADRMARTRITQDRVAVMLMQNAERAMCAEPVLNAEGKPTGEYRYEANAANKALELLGKTKGMFLERKEISGPNGGPIRTHTTPAEMSDDEIAAEIARLEAAGLTEGNAEEEGGEE